MRRRKVDRIVITLFLLMFLFTDWKLGYTAVEGSCSGRRLVLTNQTGIISDGPNDYPMNSHCEWLIEALNPRKFISLRFTMMDTECSYDFLFVFDGNTYNSRLLGSFSGNTIPGPIFAESGYMLLFLYSDTNYVLQGFEGVYTIEDCPLNCSQHGSCINGACHCHIGWTGRTCSVELCPQNCSSPYCKRTLCPCTPGYTGEACHLNSHIAGFNTWYNLSSSIFSEPLFTSRTSHSGIYLEQTNSLWIFGGYTLENVLGDLVLYNFTTGEWKTIEPSDDKLWPAARYQHAMSSYNGSFVIFGGILNDGSFSNELWFFNTSSIEWIMLAENNPVKPAARAGHSLTLVDDYILYLFGGRVENQTYLSDMYRINLRSGGSWTKVEFIGGKELDRRSVGHSAVYHRESKTIYVYGGFKLETARFGNRSNILYAYNVELNYWARIYYPEEVDREAIPKMRAYHSAVIMGQYMVVYGGNIHIHKLEEMCYDNALYLYHLGCQRWVNPKKLTTEFTRGGNYAPRGGRFSHVAAVKDGNILLISGGYSGAIKGDLIAYVSPPTIAQASNVISSSACDHHHKSTVCLDDPECVWCTAPKMNIKNCQPRKHREGMCDGDYTAGTCPGTCVVLRDCYSCMAQGQGITLEARNSSLAEPCAWVVQEGMCRRYQGQDTPPLLTIQLQPSVYGWWGRNNTRVTSVEDCRTLDMPPGLTFVKYKYPKNPYYPDEVSIVREARQGFQFVPVTVAENVLSGNYTAELKGFLHPAVQKMPTKGDQQINLTMGVTGGQAKLNVSIDESPNNAETVAEIINHKTTYLDKFASRKKGGPLFPHLHPGRKYFIWFEVRQKIALDNSVQMSSAMLLSMQGQVLSVAFLEPFSGGDCSSYNNCLMCISDAGCGWCEGQHICMFRSLIADLLQQCIVNNVSRLLITQSHECSICKDFVDCHSCLQTPLCEWFTADSHCVRSGRLSDTIKNSQQCPLACQMYKNCTSCVTKASECAWCQQTQTCFPFYSYVPAFTYGQCDAWVDNMSNASCHKCSHHKTCRQCFKDFKCGWCGNTDNPTIGICVAGDFQGPYGSMNCSAHLFDLHNIASDEPSNWSYSMCPDVQECRLGLHNCHANATCENSPESFRCLCKKGFKGDGSEFCNKTCYDDCVHGKCSEYPDFKCLCDLGWTGMDCSLNCGCNNHSTCINGPGHCDKCEDHTWTQGEFCELCRSGSFGNSVTLQGCQECQCNKHGNAALGNCDKETGVCFCIDNTAGNKCEKCLEGFYGDPRYGGQCYHLCDGRSILTNVRASGLGSYAGKSIVVGGRSSCLWILTAFSELNPDVISTPIPSITFTMHADIKLKCPENFIYVYDGIPGFVAGQSSKHEKRLAAFCGSGLDEAITVESTTGQLTVYFESINTLQGFNATFKLNRCPDSCHGNRVCDGEKCRCTDGFRGVNCNDEICLHNCSYALGHGYCEQDLNQCICLNGFGGQACADFINPSLVILEDVIDPSTKTEQTIDLQHLQRTGHTLLFDNSGRLWLYGGYSPSHGPHSTLLMFNITINTWCLASPTEETRTIAPLARYLHASAYVPSVYAFYILGGIIKNNITNDFWKFQVDKKLWLPLPTPGIPPMAGHTLTLRVDKDDESLLLIGGFSAVYGFSHKTYEFFPRSGDWRELYVTGTVPAGIYGHSTVYHAPTKTFYVYGGYLYKGERPIISNELYAFHYPKQKWTLLPSEIDNKPLPRYFHTAVTYDEFMIIFGGRSDTKDFTNITLTYKYSCNQWGYLKDNNYQVTGSPLPALIGQAAVIADGYIYIMGGFNGLSSARLLKLTMTDDLCRLKTDAALCLRTRGCTLCTLHGGGLQNISFLCHSNKKPTPQGCRREAAGTECAKKWSDEKNCSQYKTCSECLAAWPFYLNAEPMCRWCSSCTQGRCVSRNEECTKNMCRVQNHVVMDAENCSDRVCSATDCEKCMDMGHCNWTRHLKRGGDTSQSLSFRPEYDWNCYLKSMLPTNPILSLPIPPNPCPHRCYQERRCSSCLNSTGGEGGWQRCYWSENLNECMTPSYVPLRCMNGECGLILQGGPSECRQSCTVHTQCSHCTSGAGCGWCAFGGLNGRGICMRGGLKGPSRGICFENNISIQDESLPENASYWIDQSIGNPLWTFISCPEENECLNEHHTCSLHSEVCIDTWEGFRCDCKAGYIAERRRCKPICQQGCNNGECVEPNVCRCLFGYVGHNCSTGCACNSHSNCPGVNQLDTCSLCRNNTKGSQCEECQILFVGDAKKGPCESCSSFCYGHSHICLGRKSYNQYRNWTSGMPSNLEDKYLPHELAQMEGHGPKPEDAACLMCKNNTQGERCEECKSGYFRLPRDPKELRDPRDRCIPCQCNGHSNSCTSTDGLNCNCQNNTETECGRKENGSEIPCWQTQCSKCKEYFLGKPTEGHQCYRQMTVEKDYCFDPITQGECSRNPKPLLQGRTVFFAVQPKYLNVDIRITIDVTEGAVDVYFSPKEDTFVVIVNQTTGEHAVSIDRNYTYIPINNFDDEPLPFPPLRNQRSLKDTPHIHNGTQQKLQKYRLEYRRAKDLNTFVTVMYANSFLLVKNLQYRLVITLPLEIHNLRNSRFYLVLRGTPGQHTSFGNIFFRQDQPHIDLFVFFSVFFSCFFLFLAICVVVWKVKQAMDVRRARHQHAIEMQNMASRPFARVFVVIDDLPDEIVLRPIKFGRNGHEGEYIQQESKIAVRPIALETTDDGISAIGTVLLKLPGSSTSPVKMCLGSALVTMRLTFPSIQSCNSIKCATRRRIHAHT